jgi:D-3-phosphoglycerate dehydrogenase
LIRLQLDDGGAGTTLDGTLFGTSNLRIVRAFGCNMDAIPEGPMLFVCQDDVPGIIAHISNILAGAGINIDNMSVGRADESDFAVAVLNLRAEPDAQALSEMAAHPSVRWVKIVPSLATPS